MCFSCHSIEGEDAHLVFYGKLLVCKARGHSQSPNFGGSIVEVVETTRLHDVSLIPKASHSAAPRLAIGPCTWPRCAVGHQPFLRHVRAFHSLLLLGGPRRPHTDFAFLQKCCKPGCSHVVSVRCPRAPRRAPRPTHALRLASRLASRAAKAAIPLKASPPLATAKPSHPLLLSREQPPPWRRGLIWTTSCATGSSSPRSPVRGFGSPRVPGRGGQRVPPRGLGRSGPSGKQRLEPSS